MSWTKISTEKPLVYKTGDYDGKSSNPVLVRCKNNKCYVAILCSGNLDSSEFNDWYYADDDWELQHEVIEWQKIPE